MKHLLISIPLLLLALGAGPTAAQESGPLGAPPPQEEEIQPVAKPAQTQEQKPPIEAETILGTAELADQLVASLRGAGVLMGRRIAVLPFYDLNDLQTTTELGRLVGEELAAALHFRNFHLAEIRSDDQLILARWVGESYLTRTGPERELATVSAPIGALRDKHNLGGLVVGTYSVLPYRSKGRFERRLLDGRVSLNARLVDPQSGAVLAMGTKKIYINRTVEALLRRRAAPIAALPTDEIRAKRY